MGRNEEAGAIPLVGEEPFEFVVEDRRPRVSDEEIIAALQTFALRAGKLPLKRRDFDAWAEKPCFAGTIANRFGGWRIAQKRAGLDVWCDYSPEALMDHLRKVWKLRRRIPHYQTFRKYGQVSTGPYVRHWGSLRIACELLAKFERGEISRGELLRKRSDGQGGRTPVRVRERWKVLERDGQRCRVCGKRAEDGAELEVDHIVPVSGGGGNELENLQTLCRECNRGKGGKRKRRGTAGVGQDG